MELEARILALIAVGASVSANCQPCLQRNVRTALKCSADPREIKEAVGIGQRVRRGAASKMDVFASSLDVAALDSAGPEVVACGCGT